MNYTNATTTTGNLTRESLIESVKHGERVMAEFNQRRDDALAKIVCPTCGFTPYATEQGTAEEWVFCEHLIEQLKNEFKAVEPPNHYGFPSNLSGIRIVTREEALSSMAFANTFKMGMRFWDDT